MGADGLVHRGWAAWLLALGILALSGCGDKPLEPLAAGDGILAFGDSLTEGVGAAKATAYPAQLESLIGHSVVNAGVSGETTEEAMARLPQVLERHDPALMILLTGGNDVLRNQDLAQAKRNIARMIELAQGRGVQVVLVGVPRKSLFSDSAPLYRELAEFYHVPLVDDLVAGLLRRPAYKSDAVHLNAAGYRAMAERLAEELRAAGAL
jgi:lysophospholipase L1-like esterase